ncbi:hypothetical protein [Winogradskyella sp.]|uniref:hypothetical protein n=1 Tax=Winogradskyella sp. TaxID=1883156 RepID=UPI00261D65B1|nr:hypothetical protein [Winogradskyella sp.]
MILKLVYIANVIVAGWIGIMSLFYPKTAVSIIFENAYSNSEYIRLVGALWLSIAILSVFGLFRPQAFSPVLVLQLIYKSTWLMVVAIPAIINQNPYPKGMAIFFLVWVVILPFVIPWNYLFSS